MMQNTQNTMQNLTAVNKAAKSQLARLLATENIFVEHRACKTASFNIRDRILKLPIWEGVSNDLYDLLVGHETGHAIDTPTTWFTAAKQIDPDEKTWKICQGYLNVVEDARIEKLQKRRYPGLRRSFSLGYKDLLKRDFFGLKGRSPDQMHFIDRINLHYKLGVNVNVSFSTEELPFLTMIDKAETFNDVIVATRVIYAYAKQKSETDFHDGPPSDGEEGEEGDAQGQKKSGKGKGKPGEDQEQGQDDKSGPDYEKCEDGNEYRRIDPEDFENKDESNSGENSQNGDKSEKGDKESDGQGQSDEQEGQSQDGQKQGQDQKSQGQDGQKNGQAGDKVKQGVSGEDTKDANRPNMPGSGIQHSGKEKISSNVGVTAARGNAPVAETDEALENGKQSLANSNMCDFRYASIPDANLENIIVDFKEIHEHLTEVLAKSGHTDYFRAAAKKFRDDNNIIISYMVKEFDMKKAADLYCRAATAKTGIIDVNKLHSYKYNEDLFRRVTTLPIGKNHGLVMFIDWSGSMAENLLGTFEQLVAITLFCKRVQIPFEVYAFSNNVDHFPPEKVNKQFTYKTGDLMFDGHFQLLNFLSSRMRPNKFEEALANLFAITAVNSGYHYGRQTSDYDNANKLTSIAQDVGNYLSGRYTLSSTPLNDAIAASKKIINVFREKNKLQIVNAVFLTDGDSDRMNDIFIEDGSDQDTAHKRFAFQRYSYDVMVLRDKKLKTEYVVNPKSEYTSTSDLTRALLENVKDVTGVNILGFNVIAGGRAVYSINSRFRNNENGDTVDTKTLVNQMRNNGYLVCTTAGYDEYYMISGGSDLTIKKDTLDLGEWKTNKAMAKAFSEFQKKKAKNRVILSRFINKISGQQA